MNVRNQPSMNTQESSRSSNNTNIWSSILKGVAYSKMVQTKNVLVLGDPSSSKSSVIQHLLNKVAAHQTISQDQEPKPPPPPPPQQQHIDDDNTKHLALGFTYTTICDEDNDETARLGIYQLSRPDHAALLKFVLNMETIASTMILIVLDWSQPWSFVEKLQQWMQVVDQAILSFCYQHPTNKTALGDMQEKELEYMRHYADPGLSLLGVSANQVTLPLTEGSLSINYGIPIAVVCDKSDEQTRLERMADYREDKFDYIQQILRTICMKYGAALFYTSTLYPQTYCHLQQYILHRTVSPNRNTTSSSSPILKEKAQVMDRDMVMVPSGWDSWGKIKALQQDFDCQQVHDRWDIDMGGLEERQPMADTGLRFLFEQTIMDPESEYKPVEVPAVTVYENEQDFLKRHFDSLQRGGGQSSTNRIASSTAESTRGSARHHQPSLIGPLDTSMADVLDTIYATDDPSLPTNPTSNSSIYYAKDIDTSMKKLAWDKLNKGTTVPLTSSTSDTWTSPGNTILSASVSENVSSSNNSFNNSSRNPSGASNEVLTNFFQSLLSKKTTPLTSSSSSSTSSSHQSTAQRHDTATTTKMTRGSGLVS